MTITIPVCLDFIFTWPLLLYRFWKYGFTYRKIYLGGGFWTKLNQQDYYQFNGYHWCISGNGQDFYATRFDKVASGKTKTIRLHREIMNAPPGLLVDHINNDTLDNRRANLRLATHSQNSCNRPKAKRKNASSKFRGIHLDKRTGRWVAQITCQRKTLHLGCFDSELAAALAYDRAAIKYHGEFARLNLPEVAAPSCASVARRRAKLNFSEKIERSPKRLNLRSAVESLLGRLANWLGASLNFPEAQRSRISVFKSSIDNPQKFQRNFEDEALGEVPEILRISRGRKSAIGNRQSQISNQKSAISDHFLKQTKTYSIPLPLPVCVV